MPQSSFTPTLYFKNGCPFCFKVRLFLLEAGLTDRVSIRSFEPGTQEEEAMRAELAPHLARISFPAAELEPGRFVTESDEIIAFLASHAGRDPDSLPVLRQYVDGPFKQIGLLFQENRALKAAAAG
jgi:glutathione S-transferase